MLKIRFSRKGKKNKPTYRLIISEQTKDTHADVTEFLGHYNPYTKEVVLKKDRIEYWLSQGVQCSPSVHNLLVSQNILDKPKVGVSTISNKRAAKIAEKQGKEKEAVKAEEKKQEELAEKKQEDKEIAKTEEKKEEAPTEENDNSKDETKKAE